MNEVRRNKEEETVFLRAKFDMPKIYKILYIVSIAVCGIVGAGMFLIEFMYGLEMGNLTGTAGDGVSYGLISGFSSAIIPVVFAVFVFICYRLHMNAIRKGECVVTNKTIKGVTVSIFSKKIYNYRLDEIENIEIASVFGMNTLVLRFSQGQIAASSAVVYGKGQQSMSGANVFSVTYLVDVQNVYDKLSELLTSIKNDKDVAIDIEMKKIETEERKAAAFETFATQLGDKTQQSTESEIGKLEALAKLKEKGLISEEEYNIKKEELLKRI